MSSNLERFMLMILGGVIFLGATLMMYTFFISTKEVEGAINKSSEKRSSVVAAEVLDKQESVVTMSSDAVYLNILSLIDNYSEEELEAGKIQIYITRRLTTDELLKVKRHNADALANLGQLVRSYEKYRCIYAVDEELHVTAVEYQPPTV